MNYRKLNRDEHLCNNGQAKRILALDGGGIRGVLSLGILEKIEDLLRTRHGGSEEFRLSHYFDLIAGTSTGAIIAAALAQGWTVKQIHEKYNELGQDVFEKSLLRQGFLRAKYDEEKLINHLKKVYGANTKLGSDQIQTGLLVVTKRLDTGSSWPISNNPRGKYFASRPNGIIGNGDYPLWQVVRASTAAPSYFDPEEITIATMDGHLPTVGCFVDGGVSPFNNPALQAFMYATLDGYRIGWPAGAQKLLLVSVGTGIGDPAVKRAALAAKHAVGALLSLMEDCAELQQTLLQWMSSSATARTIDREIGDLRHDLVAGTPLMSYLRYDVDLSEKSVLALMQNLEKDKIQALNEMDAPENMDILHELGSLAAERDVKSSDFAAVFDLPLD